MKAEAQHTSGPWTIEGGTNEKGDLFIWQAGEYFGRHRYFGRHGIATVHGEHAEGDTAANARLIAAAPELLDQLERRAGNLEAIANYLETCCKAGMKHPGHEVANTPSLSCMIDGARAAAGQARQLIAKAEGRE